MRYDYKNHTSDEKEKERIFILASNNPCNNATEDCITDPDSGNATCNCKLGYTKNSTNPICTGKKK